MSKHTPGPWEVLCDSNVMAGNRSVASCGVTRDSSGTDRSAKIREENKANAQLIAAAPDQNDVLKELATRIETCTYCTGNGLEPNDPESACGICGGQGRVLINCTGLITEIEDALAKAKGEKAENKS